MPVDWLQSRSSCESGRNMYTPYPTLQASLWAWPLISDRSEAHLMCLDIHLWHANSLISSYPPCPSSPSSVTPNTSSELTSRKEFPSSTAYVLFYRRKDSSLKFKSTSVWLSQLSCNYNISSPSLFLYMHITCIYMYICKAQDCLMLPKHLSTFYVKCPSFDTNIMLLLR